jgi:predicted NAD-dependent protein-ADP-ribosyltransferase YbiA (DUF1768 family)
MDNVVYFFAGGKANVHPLSNFYETEVHFNGHMFPSSEHAFQSCKYLGESAARFRSQGGLTFADVFSAATVDKKQEFWMKKRNVGIVAKMATDPAVGKRLGLMRNVEFVSSWELWEAILLSKFRDNEALRDLLLATGDAYLVEFSRGAERKTRAGRPPVWAGMVKDGVQYGENRMGVYLMRIREQLRGCEKNVT